MAPRTLVVIGMMCLVVACAGRKGKATPAAPTDEAIAAICAERACRPDTPQRIQVDATHVWEGVYPRSPYVVGRGADAATVRQSVERLGLADRVTLTGPRPQADLPDWYRAADVVTLPSYSEGIPNVLRETLACGRPFVATRVGGIPELVRGPAGRLVPPGDPAALADALAAVLADPPPVTEAERAVNVSWDESARLLAEHLRAVAAHPRQP